ncbi:unnamed protein product [Acanthoscelides obtectus]|uniref:Uncharacterized protein n=1 Tax=Acanthoscelides obtectus TaxID=200917 RepID=A0A9P0Q2C8_ACAOB|nr:unnamed protein product [Acanthoscelides obtectus]CAK1659145.1 hypothetical protein AOBTE_LOCUS21307 [Acanthoscelides obtectus]
MIDARRCPFAPAPQVQPCRRSPPPPPISRSPLPPSVTPTRPTVPRPNSWKEAPRSSNACTFTWGRNSRQPFTPRTRRKNRSKVRNIYNFI